jgi:hypothetical protein
MLDNLELNSKFCHDIYGLIGWLVETKQFLNKSFLFRNLHTNVSIEEWQFLSSLIFQSHRE